MSILIVSSSYTQTTSVSVNIPVDRLVLLVATTTNSAPTFDGVSLTSSNSVTANYYWWRYINPPTGTNTLAAVSNTIINYFVLDNVDQVTPISTQININSTTLNANGTVYNVQGDNSTPLPTWFGVANLDYPGGILLTATSVTGGSILSNTYSTVNAATLTIPSVSTTSSAYNINYNTNGSGIFASPAPSWVFLNESEILREIPQMIII